MSTEEEIILIENELLELTTDAEKVVFAKKMQTDPRFANLYKEHKQAHDLVILNELYSVENDVINFMSKKRSSSYKKLITGIAVASFFIAGGFIYSLNEKEKTPVTSITHQDTLTIENTPIYTTKLDKITHNTTSKPKKITESSRIYPPIIKSRTEDSPFTIEKADSISVNLPDKAKGIKQDTADHVVIIETIKTKDAESNLPKCQFSFTTAIIVPCEKENNGEIDIQNLSGGVLPYVLNLDGVDVEVSNNYTFSSIGEGSHQLIIKDQENCDSTMTFIVTSKVCEEKNSLAFSPAYEELSFPLKDDFEGIIFIYDFAGKLVKQIDKVKHEEASWDGTNLQEEPLKGGVYMTIVKGNQEEEIFYITLIR